MEALAQTRGPPRLLSIVGRRALIGEAVDQDPADLLQDTRSTEAVEGLLNTTMARVEADLIPDQRLVSPSTGAGTKTSIAMVASKLPETPLGPRTEEE